MDSTEILAAQKLQKACACTQRCQEEEKEEQPGKKSKKGGHTDIHWS
jgi:hypothetical protein